MHRDTGPTPGGATFRITRSRPHGHVAAVLAVMDWLLPRQPRIEKSLASRHLGEGALVLYDLTSSSFEGTACPLAKLGDSRTIWHQETGARRRPGHDHPSPD